MGSCIDHLPLAFLLILAATFSLQTEARESQFFSKATRYEPTTEQETTTQLANPKETTTTAAAATNQELPPQSTNGYGLYGHGPNYFPPSTTTTHDADTLPSRFPNKEPAGDGYRSKESTNAGRATALSSADNELRGESSEWTQPKYADPSEAYGMSDTRVQENGRYFYDVGNGRRQEPAVRGRYEGAHGRGPIGYGGGYDDVGAKGINGGYEYYTNYAMENEGGYNYKNNPESQQEYIP